MYICYVTRAKSGKEVTNCILSPPFRAVTDISIYIIFPGKKEEKILQSLREEKVKGTFFFISRRPVLLVYVCPKVDSIITRFVVMVHLGCLYSSKLHSSLLDRRIISKLTDFEIKSKRTLRWDENLG